MLFGREAQSARGDEVERARIAHDLSDHTGEIAAAQPFLQSEQRVLGRLGLDMNQPLAQILGKPMKIRSPAEPDRARVLHPQNMTTILRLSGRILTPSGDPQSVAR